MNKKLIRLTEADLHRIITESVKRILNENQYNDFEAAKYKGKWSVYDNRSQTFSHVGVGKKKANDKAREMNNYCAQKDKEQYETNS